MSRIFFDNPLNDPNNEFNRTERRAYHRRKLNSDRREILRFEENAEPRRRSIERRMNSSFTGSAN